jgi:hypothetical protein
LGRRGAASRPWFFEQCEWKRVLPKVPLPIHGRRAMDASDLPPGAPRFPRRRWFALMLLAVMLVASSVRFSTSRSSGGRTTYVGLYEGQIEIGICPERFYPEDWPLAWEWPRVGTYPAVRNHIWGSLMSLVVPLWIPMAAVIVWAAMRERARRHLRSQAARESADAD